MIRSEGKEAFQQDYAFGFRHLQNASAYKQQVFLLRSALRKYVALPGLRCDMIGLPAAPP